MRSACWPSHLCLLGSCLLSHLSPASLTRHFDSLSLDLFNLFVCGAASLRCLMGSLTSALSVRKQPDGALVSGSSRLPASDTAKTPRPQICTSKLRDRGTRATTSFHPSAHDTHPHTHPQWYVHQSGDIELEECKALMDAPSRPTKSAPRSSGARTRRS